MLVTELCEGGSLTRNIVRGKVSWYNRGRKVLKMQYLCITIICLHLHVVLLYL